MLAAVIDVGLLGSFASSSFISQRPLWNQIQRKNLNSIKFHNRIKQCNLSVHSIKKGRRFTSNRDKQHNNLSWLSFARRKVVTSPNGLQTSSRSDSLNYPILSEYKYR